MHHFVHGGFKEVKRGIILACLALFSLAGQERTTRSRVPATNVNRESSVSQVSYQPDDVKILGDLNYGQSSGWVTCGASPRYHAFVFNGYGGDRVDITVQSKTSKPWVALADSSLNQVATGSSHLSLSLPNKGPDIEVWYILFREADNRPTPFSVRVKRLETETGKATVSGFGNK